MKTKQSKVVKNLIFMFILGFSTNLFAAGSQINQDINYPVVADNFQGYSMPGNEVNQLNTPQTYLDNTSDPVGNSVDQNQLTAATPTLTDNPGEDSHQNTIGNQENVPCSNWTDQNSCDSHSCKWFVITNDPNIKQNTCHSQG